MASTVDAAHLQKQMVCVLKDDTMNIKEKLATYNALMTRSQILTSKAKAMLMEPCRNDSPVLNHASTNISEEEGIPDERPVLGREKTKEKVSPEALAKEIDKVPISYRETVKINSTV